MPLLPSRTLILTHSIAGLAVSTILLTRPSLLTSSAPVWLIGEAMRIRETASFSSPSELLATLALTLAVLAVVESAFAASLGGIGSSSKSGGAVQSLQAFAERAAILHSVQGQWMLISTIKALVYGLLVMYSYLTTPREQGMGYVPSLEKNAGRQWGLGLLNNRITFVAAFTEMLFWGYIWTTLKEEERELATRIKKRREEESEKGEDVAL